MSTIERHGTAYHADTPQKRGGIMYHPFGKETTIPEIAHRIRYERLQASLLLRSARKKGPGIAAECDVILAQAHSQAANVYHAFLCEKLGIKENDQS